MAGEVIERQGRLALLAGAVTLVAGCLWVATPSQAFPYFARKYDVTCHTCHSIVPKLNATGHAFRELGYRFPDSSTRRTIPFAGGFAVRYENRQSDDVDDAYLNIVKAVTGGSLGDRASYIVKWTPVNKQLDAWGNLVDRSGAFDDVFLNLDVTESIRFTAGQFRVFNQFDTRQQLSASMPVALAAPVPGERDDDPLVTELRAYSPAARTPAIMFSYHAPGEREESNAADGWYAHLAIPFTGQFSIPVSDRARRRGDFELESAPKGIVLESYLRRGASSFGGSAFVDSGRQLYTGLVAYERPKWGTSAAVSAAIFDGRSELRSSWWGEYRPTYYTNVGLRLDDPGAGSLGVAMYGDYQWFTERAMVWVLVEQQLRTGASRTVFQVKTVF